jgi:LmbE family N-acetylglucosaminyl deacetylase
LEAAGAYVGFNLVTPARDGVEGINPDARERDPARWAASVAAVLASEQPQVVFLPHGADWNKTHTGVHHLVVEAMRRLPLTSVPSRRDGVLGRDGSAEPYDRGVGG